MGKPNLDLSKEKIAEFCRRWSVREFSLFGSILQEDFRADSDVDVIVDFNTGTTHSLFDLVSMTDELKIIFGRDVDLMTRQDVERSRNYIRRKSILSSMEVVHVSCQCLSSRYPSYGLTRDRPNSLCTFCTNVPFFRSAHTI